MALAKNQLTELTVTAVTGEGNGVARYIDADTPAPGMVVFLPRTAIGDVVRSRIVKVQKNHAFGRVEEVLTASPDRGADPCGGCAVFGRCGGCTWRHVTYAAELRYKQQWVADTLSRIGGLTVAPLPIVGADDPDRYRNKAQFPVAPAQPGGADPFTPQIGFFAPRSHQIVPVRDCLLQPESFAPVLDAVADWMTQNGVLPYDETEHTGLLRHIFIRQGAVTGQMMVCLVCRSGRLPDVPGLIRRARAAAPQLTSLCVDLNRARTNVILGGDGFTLWGEDAITDELCGLRFRLSPWSFYQVDHAQTERLYRLAAEAAALTGEETLLDLYCGTGTIGLSMAHRARQLIGVEIVPAAVEDARRNAQQNGIDNARFLCADAAAAARQLADESVRPDVIVLDPPRKGCDPSLIRTMCGMAPSRIVYISCDPATLSRDLRLLGEAGYRTVQVQPVDFFPRTAHCENIALLTKER